MNMKESDPELASIDNVCHALVTQYRSPDGYIRLRLWTRRNSDARAASLSEPYSGYTLERHANQLSVGSSTASAMIPVSLTIRLVSSLTWQSFHRTHGCAPKWHRGTLGKCSRFHSHLWCRRGLATIGSASLFGKAASFLHSERKFEKDKNFPFLCVM